MADLTPTDDRGNDEEDSDFYVGRLGCSVGQKCHFFSKKIRLIGNL